MHPNSHRADLIRNAALIAWDELPGANIAAVEAADEICHLITKNDHPFGGIPFVGVGDFRQVGPVIKGLGKMVTLHASIKSSILWPSFKHLCLHSHY
jgi:PIF1 helicase.